MYMIFKGNRQDRVYKSVNNYTQDPFPLQMRVIVLTLMVAAAASACRYYCKTPDDEAYCCDGGKEYRNPEGKRLF